MQIDEASAVISRRGIARLARRPEWLEGAVRPEGLLMSELRPAMSLCRLAMLLQQKADEAAPVSLEGLYVSKGCERGPAHV